MISEWYQHRNSPRRTFTHTPHEVLDTGGGGSGDGGGGEESIPHDIGVVVEPGDTDFSDNESVDTSDPDAPPQAPTPPPLPIHDEHQGMDHAEGGQRQPQPHRPLPTPANRPISTKKARSLARRDARRAYHEFLQNEREQRRLAEASGAEEREAALRAEKARRAEVERRIAEKLRLERERRKEEERREREEEERVREEVVREVRGGLEESRAVNLEALAARLRRERGWVEGVVKAAGLMKGRKGEVVMVSEGGWLVRVGEGIMKELYCRAVAAAEKTGGRLSMEDLGEMLEGVLTTGRKKVKAKVNVWDWGVKLRNG